MQHTGAEPVFNQETLKKTILSELVLEVTVLIWCGRNIPLHCGFNSYKNPIHSPNRQRHS